MSTFLIDRILDPDTNTDDGSEDAEIKVARMDKKSVSDNDWPLTSPEGELAVDVYHEDDAIVIRAAVAGVNLEDISVEIQNDIVTVRGKRHQNEIVDNNSYIYQECHWGTFSRSIVLPEEIRTEDASATLQNGILKIILPKAARTQSKAVPIIETEEEGEK